MCAFSKTGQCKLKVTSTQISIIEQLNVYSIGNKREDCVVPPPKEVVFLMDPCLQLQTQTSKKLNSKQCTES